MSGWRGIRADAALKEVAAVMNIQNIDAFLAIIRTGTLSKAAAELCLTQSAVSHRLRALEEEIGATLLARHQGRQIVTLTRKGEEFIPIAERWLSLLKDTTQLAMTEQRLNLTIASVDSLNIYLFPPLYRRLMHLEESRLSLRIRTHQSNEIYTLLDMQEIDVGFVLRPIMLRNIRTQEILRERMVLIKRCAGGGGGLLPLSVRELDPAREFYIDWSPSFHAWHEHWWPSVVRPELHVDTAALILQLMEEPEAWSIVPLSMAQEFQRLQQFQLYSLREEPPERIIYKLTHKYPRAGSAEAIALLEKYLAEFLLQRERG